MSKIKILSLVLLTISLTACINFNQKPASEKVSLNYWGVFEPQENMQELIQEYQTLNPNVTITYTRKGLRDYSAQILARTGQENGPDIFRYHNSWVPTLQSVLSESPQQTNDEINFSQTFYPIVLKDLQLNRGYRGIPLMYDGLGLFYNKKLFQQAGMLEPPKTWDDIIEAAIKLRAFQPSGALEVAGIAMGSTKNVDYWSDIFTLLMEQNIASLKQPGSTTEKTESALNFFRKPLTDRLWDESFSSSTEAFAQGKAAMIFGISWSAFEIQQQNPSLDFAVAPVPQLPGSKIGIASYWVEGVSSKVTPQKQTEAWKFLTFLAKKETQQRLHAIQAKTRLFGEPYSRKDLASELSNNQYMAGILDTAPVARSFYISDKTFGSGMNGELKDYYQKVVNREKTLVEADKDIQIILNNYGVPALQ